jgi:prevent-host-death family protein
MNKIITASEANRQFSKILRSVGKGDSYTITSHGEPVATLAPSPAKLQKERERAKKRLMTWLESLPTQDIGPWTREELYDDVPK